MTIYLDALGEEISTETARAFAEERLGRPLTEGELALDLVALDLDLARGKERLVEAIETERRRALEIYLRGGPATLRLTPEMEEAMLELLVAGRRHGREELERLGVQGARSFAEPRHSLSQILADLGADWREDEYERTQSGVPTLAVVPPVLDADGWGRQPPRLALVFEAQLDAKPGEISVKTAMDNPDKYEPIGGFRYRVKGSERPPEFLFRAISEEDWEQIQSTGQMRSDERMNLAREGTVASFDNPSFYLPGGLASDEPGTYRGRIVRIRYRDEDGWRHDRDGYAKTDKPIPLSQIDKVSPPLERDVFIGDRGWQERSEWRTAGEQGPAERLRADDSYTQLVVGAKMRIREDAGLHENLLGQEGTLRGFDRDTVDVYLPEFNRTFKFQRRAVDLLPHPQAPRDQETRIAMRVWRGDFAWSSNIRAMIEGRKPAPAFVDDTRMREHADAIDSALADADPLGRIAYRIVAGSGARQKGEKVSMPVAAVGFDRSAVEDYRRSFLIGQEKPTLYVFPEETRGVYFPDGQEAIVRGDFEIDSVEWDAKRKVFVTKLKLDEPARDRQLGPERGDDRFRNALRELAKALTAIRVRLTEEANAARFQRAEITEELLDKLDKRIPGAKDFASKTISGLLIGGIGDVYETNADLFPCFIYSAVMDAATCGVCRTYDGRRYETWVAGEADLPGGGPNPFCLGDGRCRCRLVPCAPGESAEDQPAPPVGPVEEIRAAIAGFPSLTEDELDEIENYREGDLIARYSGNPSSQLLDRERRLNEIGRMIETEAQRRAIAGHDPRIEKAQKRFDKAEAKFQKAMRERLGAVERAEDRIRQEPDYLDAIGYRVSANADPEVLRRRERENRARTEMRAAEDDLAKAGNLSAGMRDAYLEVLSELRPMGEGLTVEPPLFPRDDEDPGTGVRLTRKASRFYPSDWLDASNESRFYAALDWGGGRGHYNDYAQEVILTPNSSGTSDEIGFASALHELGHRMQHSVREVRAWEWVFHKRRTVLSPDPKDHTDAALRDLHPGSYEIGERTWADKFANSYMGKLYAGGPNAVWELLTMGMESLFAGNAGSVYRLGEGTEKANADYRAFILGLLATVRARPGTRHAVTR